MDSAGRVVNHIETPWARDASGNNVTTSYTVEDGRLIQSVSPSATSVYPIGADPQFGWNGPFPAVRFTKSETSIARVSGGVLTVCGKIAAGLPIGLGACANLSGPGRSSSRHCSRTGRMRDAGACSHRCNGLPLHWRILPINWRTRLLNYLRESAEARQATNGRRLYGYISAAIIVLLPLAVIFWSIPLWLFFVIVVASVALDIVLIRKWINEDLLNKSRVSSSRASPIPLRGQRVSTT